MIETLVKTADLYGTTKIVEYFDKINYNAWKNVESLSFTVNVYEFFNLPSKLNKTYFFGDKYLINKESNWNVYYYEFPFFHKINIKSFLELEEAKEYVNERLIREFYDKKYINW